MTQSDYDFLCSLLKERSGLVLAAGKQYLVESRLLPVARKAGLPGLAALVQKLRTRAEPLIAEVVEAMTTNESLFFRDKAPFEQFRDVMMPALRAARPNRRIRIWCAAAASGQEPYSLAMCVREMGHEIAGWRIEILATDISMEVLERAKAGAYSQFEVQRGLPIALLVKYFSQVGDRWQIAPEIREMVQFRRLNLLQEFSHLGSFDIVFCRNVLIYFDQDTKIRVLENIARTMRQDGYLVLGAAETVIGLTSAFEPTPDQPGIYLPTPMTRRTAGTAAGRDGRRVVPLARAR